MKLFPCNSVSRETYDDDDDAELVHAMVIDNSMVMERAFILGIGLL